MNEMYQLPQVREAMAMDEFREYFSDFEWPWYMPVSVDCRSEQARK